MEIQEDAVHKYLKYAIPISNAIIFILEVIVIVGLFQDLPDSAQAKIFWVSAAFVITAIHLSIVINLKTHLLRKSLLSIPYFLVYLLIVSVFFISSLAFNLKTIENKSHIERFGYLENESIYKAIQYNDITIQKYSDAIEKTNDIRAITKWRYEVTRLQRKNDELYNGMKKQTNEIKSDSFDLISQRTGVNRSLILFWFLLGIWGILEIGLIMTAPILKMDEKEKKSVKEKLYQFNKQLAPRVRRLYENLMKYLDHYVRDEKKMRVQSILIMPEKTGIPLPECYKIRNILVELLDENGNPLFTIAKGWSGMYRPMSYVKNVINILNESIDIR
ncbi:MAG: hypothetical protein ACP5N7_02375 [Candidatus Pacearchaeota archaeon]